MKIQNKSFVLVYMNMFIVRLFWFSNNIDNVFIQLFINRWFCAPGYESLYPLCNFIRNGVKLSLFRFEPKCHGLSIRDVPLSEDLSSGLTARRQGISATNHLDFVWEIVCVWPNNKDLHVAARLCQDLCFWPENRDRLMQLPNCNFSFIP